MLSRSYPINVCAKIINAVLNFFEGSLYLKTRTNRHCNINMELIDILLKQTGNIFLFASKSAEKVLARSRQTGIFVQTFWLKFLLWDAVSHFRLHKGRVSHGETLHHVSNQGLDAPFHCLHHILFDSCGQRAERGAVKEERGS